MHPASSRLLLSTILAYVLHCIDGCSRNPARTKPTTTTPSPGSTTTEASRGSGQAAAQLVCTAAEEDKAACMHGGTCFALNLLDARSAHCACPEEWTGTRCQLINEDFLVLQAEQVVAASIAAGVALVIIVVTIVVVCLVMKKRKERKERGGQGGLVLSTNGCPAGRALIPEKDKENNELEELQKCTDV